jgi:hypothetical protein
LGTIEAGLFTSPPSPLGSAGLDPYLALRNKIFIPESLSIDFVPMCGQISV